MNLFFPDFALAILSIIMASTPILPLKNQLVDFCALYTHILAMASVFIGIKLNLLAKKGRVCARHARNVRARRLPGDGAREPAFLACWELGLETFHFVHCVTHLVRLAPNVMVEFWTFPPVILRRALF